MKSELLSVDDTRKQKRRGCTGYETMSKAATLNGRVPASSAGGAPDFHDYVSPRLSPSSPPILTDESGAGQRGDCTPRKIAPCETDHIYANFSGNNNNNNNNNNRNNVSELVKIPATNLNDETQKLKEILFTQLDVIQRQREEISQKDREVNRLKQEKEALNIRLERMERRVSYLKEQHKKRKSSSDMGLEGGPNCPNSINNSSYTHIIGNSSPIIGLGFNEDLNSKSLTRSRKRNRYSTESLKETVKTTDFASPVKNDFRWSKSSSGISTSSTKPPDSFESNNNKKTSSVSQQFIGSHRRLSLSVESKNQDEMLTDKPYHTLLDISCRLPLPENNSKTCSTIEVPSWRYHPVTSCYQLEGTENIDDDIFLKRHLKLEIDEKRRKRWDIQRLREQRQVEKLRRGRIASREARKNQVAERVSTYFPAASDVQCIEISEKVPIVAFGCIIPDVKPSNFSLSWFSVANRLKDEQSRTIKKVPRESSTRTLSRRGT